MQDSNPQQPPSGPPPPGATLPVRRATPADLPALVALERSAFAEPWSGRSLGSELENPGSVVLLAEVAAAEAAGGQAERRAAAYAAWRCAAGGLGAGGEAELLRLAVAPGLRRRRLASTLLAAGDEALAAADCTVCFLEVRADNRGAIAFYEAHGFHRIGRRRGYYGGTSDALLYARPVRPPGERPDGGRGSSGRSGGGPGGS